MRYRTSILILTGFLFTAAITWLLVTQGKTPAKVARTDTAVGNHRKTGMVMRHREASEAVPLTKRLKERRRAADDLESYLIAHERSRESLIAAFLASGDPELIREAAERFPDDPMVLMLALGRDVSPDQRREWAENLKRMQSENALAAYLMAWAFFEEGDSVAALDELRRGVGLKSFDAFLKEGGLLLEGFHLELGCSPEEAKFRGVMDLSMPYLQTIREVTKELESMTQGAASKDQATELAILGAAIGNQFSEGPGRQLVIQQLVGLRTEEQFLRLLDPDLASTHLSDTPRSLIQQVLEERRRIFRASEAVNYDTLRGEGLMSEYLDRVMVEGEASANTWAVERLDAR